jgi:hypothetical protein
VNRHLIKQLPVWNEHAQADEIRIHYKYTITLLENLLSFIYEHYPSIALKSRVTHFSLPQIKMELKQKLTAFGEYLDKVQIDQELKDLLLFGLFQLIYKKNLTIGDKKYISDLLTSISTTIELNTQLLIGLLIVYDFHLPEFFLYCVRNFQKKLDELPGLHEQKEMLLQEKNSLYDLRLKTGKRAGQKSSVVFQELNNYLDEKYEFVKQLVKLRRELVRDQQKANAGKRFQINLPVPQFGLFIRMQIEKGILVKENVGEIFSFFANHFYTANTTYISAESMQKKSTDVEFTTAQKMKGHLIGMLNWLNTNYNLSNYN